MASKLDFDIRSFEVGTRGKRQWTLERDSNGDLTFEELINFLNNGLVGITDDVLTEEIRKGFPKEYIQVTDNVKGKPYQQVDVRRKGSIDISAQESVQEIVTFIYRIILNNSPVDTGRFIDSHLIFYNNKEVAESLDEAIKWSQNIIAEPGDVIRFLNYQPYARKLEREGIVRGRINPKIGKSRKSNEFSSQEFGLKPNGTYKLAQAAASKRFSRGLARFKFEFIQGESSFQNLSNIKRKTFKLDGRPYLYPSIEVKF